MFYFVNPYPDYSGSNLKIDSEKIKKLIESYVKKISENGNSFSDGDLYTGSSGVAYMFLKLHQSQSVESLNQSALQNAKIFIDHAKQFRRSKLESSVAFLCGNAGILAVSAVINKELGDSNASIQDLNQFLQGTSVAQIPVFNRYGCDEILFGRAGYLSAVFWINQNIPKKLPGQDFVEKITNEMIKAGTSYAQRHKLNIRMMWECYGDKYIGAAHGISAILHMMLETSLSGEKLGLVKATIDEFLEMQSPDGNFPCVLEDARKPEHKLVHWCHGAPGVVYLFAKAFIVFKEQKYLDACLKCGELVWIRGLLKKGPGICHGIAGNGYVFLVLYRLTGDHRHLYRALRFADFLTTEEFIREARIPDSPYSLYEGLAGTVCFLVDLLKPDKASFPFMDVFDVKI